MSTPLQITIDGQQRQVNGRVAKIIFRTKATAQMKVKGTKEKIYRIIAH